MSGTGGFFKPEETLKQLNIGKGLKVADFGCGAGYFTIPIAKAIGDDGKVYAFDVLDTALESVRSRARLEGLFNIEEKKCDLEILRSSGSEDKSIDMVFLVNILFQSDNKAGIIKEASRILKEGGKMIIIDWQKNRVMGPPKDLIVPVGEIKKIAENENSKFEKDIVVDKYHWGMVFRKI